MKKDEFKDKVSRIIRDILLEIECSELDPSDFYDLSQTFMFLSVTSHCLAFDHENSLPIVGDGSALTLSPDFSKK